MEAARLMGFGEMVRCREDMPVSDTQAYRQFGNAIVPVVVEAVARQALRTMVGHLAVGRKGCLLKAE